MSRKVYEGKVIKNSNDKTIVVDVERRFMEKKYKKFIKRNKKYAVHDENNVHTIGDLVKIVECRPYSKTKKFMIYKESDNKGKK